uniref:Putative synaptophysin-like 2a n=1 Tax=Corethrella appendiculata TaxID=1370023 RepID=U5ENQ2_9DIPT
MNYTIVPFQEPRGVMRILQLIFAICAFATTVNFDYSMSFDCGGKKIEITIDYPFRTYEKICDTGAIPLDVSSDAKFFVATGVLSLMYCLFIIAVYAVFEELYKSKSEIPIADFMLTTILAIFWLSGSAAWSNGTNTFKASTDSAAIIKDCTGCQVTSIGSFSGLNISLLLGYLNFFLWASDLWFIYKETIWFQGRQTGTDVQAT